MRHRAGLVLRARSVRIVIGRVADDMVEASRQYRRHLADVGVQHPHPVGEAVRLGILIGKRGEVAIFFNSGDLHLAKPVCQTQAHAAHAGPQIEDPPAVGSNGRRQKHRIGADPVAVRRLRDLHRFIQKMVVRDLHHRHVIMNGIAL